jgi:hypothetical protein
MKYLSSLYQNDLSFFFKRDLDIKTSFEGKYYQSVSKARSGNQRNGG